MTGVSLPIQAVDAILERHGEGFETSPAPNQSDRARIIMATPQIRPIRVEGNVAYVQLTRGYEAIIDAEDVPLVEGWNWYAHVQRRADGKIRAVYAVRDSRGYVDAKQKEVRLHRIIMSAPDDLAVDHIDCNGLNNRRANLRLATRAENNKNSRMRSDNASGFKGVHWNATYGKWNAQIRVNGKRLSLGYFTDIEDASGAYAKASAELHGDFGRIS